jgi:hypothetical protein
MSTGYRRPDKPDERDFRPKASLLRAAEGRTYRYWIAGPLWDQGNTPHCVEYSTRGLLGCSPVRQDAKYMPRGAIYNWCQDNDEWPGKDYEGTSVHAAMKWLKAHGYVSSYEWARTVEQVHAHHMLRGPSVWGTTWYEAMSYVDDFGYARIGGQNWGGHAYLIRGGNSLKKDPETRRLGAFKIRNSWGPTYGKQGVYGEAWLPFTDAQNLIDDYGEVALPVELKRLTPAVLKQAMRTDRERGFA